MLGMHSDLSETHVHLEISHGCPRFDKIYHEDTLTAKGGGTSSCSVFNLFHLERNKGCPEVRRLALVPWGQREREREPLGPSPPCPSPHPCRHRKAARVSHLNMCTETRNLCCVGFAVPESRKAAAVGREFARVEAPPTIWAELPWRRTVHLETRKGTSHLTTSRSGWFCLLS